MAVFNEVVFVISTLIFIGGLIYLGYVVVKYNGMGGFNKSVLVMTIAAFIGCVIYFAYKLSKSKENEKYPPVVANCPDYWLDQSDKNDGSNCGNKNKLGDPQCPTTMNFSGPIWNGSNGLCAKSTWANSCGLTWDGVSSSTCAGSNYIPANTNTNANANANTNANTNANANTGSTIPTNAPAPNNAVSTVNASPVSAIMV